MKAVQRALEMAEKEGAQVTLMSVAYYSKDDFDEMPPNIQDKLESQAANALKKAKALFDAKKIPVEAGTGSRGCSGEQHPEARPGIWLRAPPDRQQRIDRHKKGAHGQHSGQSGGPGSLHRHGYTITFREVMRLQSGLYFRLKI